MAEQFVICNLSVPEIILIGCLLRLSKETLDLGRDDVFKVDVKKGFLFSLT
jgi:hypothetical protein